MIGGSNSRSSRAVSIETDVAVVGGGTAGCAAAIAAARLGCKTVLIERDNCLGGEASTGLVGGAENQFYSNDLHKGVGGVPAEVIERVHQYQFGTSLDWSRHVWTYWFCHEPEIVKLALMDLCIENGVELLFGSDAIGVETDGHTIAGIKVRTADGHYRICSNAVVDATGAGDVLSASGIDSTRLSSPCSLLFRVANVDLEATYRYILENPRDLHEGDGEVVAQEIKSFVANWENGYFYLIDRAGTTLNSLVRAAVEKGDYSVEKYCVGKLDRLGMEGIAHAGSVQINTGWVRLDGSNPLDLSRSETNLYRTVAYIMSFLTSYVPGFQNAVIAATAARMGRRYVRRFQTVGIIDAEHPEVEPRDAVGRYFTSPHRRHERREPRFIPYSCLVPESVDGIIVGSGKTLNSGCDWQPHRAIGSTMVVGEIAGTAAAISVRSGVRLRELSTGEIRTTIGTW